RFHCGRGEQKQADAAFAKAAALTPDELNRFVEAGWWVAGPYPKDIAMPCPPELGADPSRPALGIGEAGEAPWRHAVTRLDGRVDLAPLFGAAKDVSGCALTCVYSPDERTTTLLVGGTGKLRLWINGRLVHETAEAKTWVWGLDRVPVTLHAGR